MTNFDFLSPIQNLQIDSANKQQLGLLMLLTANNFYCKILAKCNSEQNISIDFAQLEEHQSIALIRELCDLMEEHLLSQ